MSNRAEFNKKAEVILDFMDSYETIRQVDLAKFFPKDNKVIAYLLKNRRLFESIDDLYISTSIDVSPDRAMSAALGVLGDIFDKVHSHTRATPPAQISFTTHSGDYYEIIYVRHSMEAMVTALFTTQLTTKQKDKSHEDKVKRMVIIEDLAQMDRLQIPNIMRFALISPNGELTYYKAKGVD